MYCQRTEEENPNEDNFIPIEARILKMHERMALLCSWHRHRSGHRSEIRVSIVCSTNGSYEVARYAEIFMHESECVHICYK